MKITPMIVITSLICPQTDKSQHAICITYFNCSINKVSMLTGLDIEMMLTYAGTLMLNTLSDSLDTNRILQRQVGCDSRTAVVEQVKDTMRRWMMLLVKRLKCL